MTIFPFNLGDDLNELAEKLEDRSRQQSTGINLPGLEGRFVRFYHGAITAALHGNSPLSADEALASSAATDRPLEVRVLKRILKEAPADTFGVQIFQAWNLHTLFGLLARQEIPEIPVVWIGNELEQATTPTPILVTRRGVSIRLPEKASVYNWAGDPVWPSQKPARDHGSSFVWPPQRQALQASG